MIPVTFGASLKRLRMERGLSQEELARRLGTSKQAISRYENGARVPKISTVSALAAAMGSLAVRALRSDDASLQKTAEELRQMTDYMVFQIDEELRAREPLDRRRVEENVTRTDLDSALRVASDIPNEIVYIMCRCIELMKEVVDKGDDLTACSALAAVHLSMAAIRCMQAELLSYAKIMDDDVFGYTIVREAELNLADHQELVDGLVEELTRRLTREKK